MERERFKRTMKAQGHWRDGEQRPSEPVSYIREDDSGSVTLIERNSGYWVDGAPSMSSTPTNNHTQEAPLATQPPTGEDLILALEHNEKLMSLNNCPAAPVEFSRAVYGAVQNDTGSGGIIENKGSMQKQINSALGFIGANSETAVWHFLLGPTVHHFVIIPWYQQSLPQGIVYTLFMAYEDKYLVGDYVGKTTPAPAGIYGYKRVWTTRDLNTMFTDLLTNPGAWEGYLGAVGESQASKITYWKYKTTTLTSAIANVKLGVTSMKST